MRSLFLVAAGLALWSCHEHKPRPVTDCGDSCTDAGEPDAGEPDAGEADAEPDAGADASDASDDAS